MLRQGGAEAGGSGAFLAVSPLLCEPPWSPCQCPQAELGDSFTPTGVPTVYATQLVVALAGGFRLISELRLQTCSALSTGGLDLGKAAVVGTAVCLSLQKASLALCWVYPLWQEEEFIQKPKPPLQKQ